VKADLRIRLDRGIDGSVAARGNLATPPFWCRWDGDTLWIVGSTAFPVADDEVSLTVQVGAGVDATVHSVAATIVYAASGEGTRITTRLEVAEGATLRWLPEPVIVTERARHRALTTVHAAADAVVCLDEVMVLGRSAEACGSIRTALRVEVDGAPRLRTSFDSTLPGWDGPGGTAGARISATRLLLGRDVDAGPPEDRGPIRTEDPPAPTGAPRRCALLTPEGGGQLALALADDPDQARQLLDAVLAVPLARPAVPAAVLAVPGPA
jgi:urease accessory protein